MALSIYLENGKVVVKSLATVNAAYDPAYFSPVQAKQYPTEGFLTATRVGSTNNVSITDENGKYIVYDLPYTEFKQKNGTTNIGSTVLNTVSTLNGTSYFGFDVDFNSSISSIDTRVGGTETTLTDVGKALRYDKNSGADPRGIYYDDLKGTSNSLMAIESTRAIIQAGLVTRVDLEEASGVGTIDFNVLDGSGNSYTGVSLLGAPNGTATLLMNHRSRLGFTDGTYNALIGISGLTASRNLTIPDKDGTIALTTDIPATFSIDDLSDVDTSTVVPSTNQVLKWDGTNWSPADDDTGGGGGGGSDSFNTITVSGQSDVVAESGNDTLTLAAGSNVVITTDATTDTITIALPALPVIDGLLVGTNGMISSGPVNVNNTLAANSLTVSGQSTTQFYAVQVNTIITAQELDLTGGNSIISVSGPVAEDIEIRSNGNVSIKLDADDDETGQKFAVFDPGTTERFSVSDDGVVRINSAYTLPPSDGSAGQVLMTDGDGLVEWDTISGGSSSPADIGQIYKTSNQTLTTTFTAITSWDNEDYDDLTALSPTAGTLTLTQAGKYLIQVDVHIDNSSGSDRSSSQIYLELNSTEVSGTRRGLYHRLAGDGETSATISYIYEHVSGTAVFKVMAAKTSGADTLYVNNALMNYATLGGAQGVAGAQGNAGDAFTTEAVTSSRNLVPLDNLKYLRVDSSTAVSITVLPESSAPYPTDMEIVFEQAGTGKITIVEGSGVTVNTSETLSSGQQYAVIGLKKVGTDLWTLTGEREAV